MRWSRSAALAAAGWLAGCAAIEPPPLTAAILERPPPGLAAGAELKRVRFHAQTPYHCGSAALAMVLTDAGLPSDPESLADKVFVPAREGALQIEMLAAARRRGAPVHKVQPAATART